MIILTGKKEEVALGFLEAAAKIAGGASCRRSRCGSVIVKDGEVIGRGFNSPPGGLESQRRCAIRKSSYDVKVTDKTCCVHAEQRAIMDALRNHPDVVGGSRLYFIKLGEDGEPSRAGEPYCTICSKMALDAGISEFVLWQDRGVCVFGAEEYNDVSFAFQSSPS